MVQTAASVSRSVALMAAAAEREGFELRVVDHEHGHLVELCDHKRSIALLGGLSPLNDAVASRIAQDKFYTAQLLQRAGFRVPHSVRCLRPGFFRTVEFGDATGAGPGLAFASEHGYPLIVKPNRMSLGRDVQLVDDEPSLHNAIHRVWEGDYLALVQPVVPGKDVRIDFLDGLLLAAYQRRALHIVGDGTRTIGALLVEADRRFTSEELRERLTREAPWPALVASCGWGYDTVLDRGVPLHLGSAVQNLNRWATADVIDDLPDAWTSHCLRIGEELRLRHFGIDFKVPAGDDADGWRTVDPMEATVIEVNGSPSLVQLGALGYMERALEAQGRVLRAVMAVR